MLKRLLSVDFSGFFLVLLTFTVGPELSLINASKLKEFIQVRWCNLIGTVYNQLLTASTNRSLFQPLHRADCQKTPCNATVLLTSAYQKLFNMSISVCLRDCDLTIEAAIKTLSADMLSYYLFLNIHTLPNRQRVSHKHPFSWNRMA